MPNASSPAAGEAMPAADPRHASAVAPNAATLVHGAIAAMLARSVPPTVELELPRSGIVLAIASLPDGRTVMLGRKGRAS